MPDYYNSAYTGAQIDGAIGAVRTKETTWDGKQDALVSGTNIKTINGSTILGSGDISVGGDSYTLSAGATADEVVLNKNSSALNTVTVNNVANATSATNATNDANGNPIAGTYVNKAGDTMSGNLTVNAEITANKINEGAFHWVISNGYLILQRD